MPAAGTVASRTPSAGPTFSARPHRIQRRHGGLGSSRTCRELDGRPVVYSRRRLKAACAKRGDFDVVLTCCLVVGLGRFDCSRSFWTCAPFRLTELAPKPKGALPQPNTYPRPKTHLTLTDGIQAIMHMCRWRCGNVRIRSTAKVIIIMVVVLCVRACVCGVCVCVCV